MEIFWGYSIMGMFLMIYILGIFNYGDVFNDIYIINRILWGYGNVIV